MSKQFRNLIIITLVLGLMIGGLTGCSSNKTAQTSHAKNSSNQQAEKSIPVEVIRAKQSEITKYIKVTGKAKPVKSTQITPELQEQTAKVLVEVGDKVKIDEELIQLNQNDAQAQIEEAKAALNIAKTKLNELLAGTREEEINSLKAQLKTAEANYKQSKKDYERYKNLFAKEVASKQELERIKNQYISAKSGYQSAQEKLKMAQKGPTEEQIASQKAQVNQARASLQKAKLNLAKTEIKAPIAGLVAAVNIEEGEMASPQQPVVSIVDLSRIEIKTYISEQHINKLDIGQEVEVNFTALDKDFIGKIKTISPAVDPNQKKFPVEIRIKNNSQLIKSGMYATVKLKTDSSSKEIVIPKESIIQDNDKDYVYIIQNGKAVKKEVRVGLTTKEKAAILLGINPGDQVVTRGTRQVTTGYKVRIVGEQ